MNNVTLKVEGMRCKRCAAAIQALLELHDGVRKVSAQFNPAEARVLYDPGTTKVTGTVTGSSSDGSSAFISFTCAGTPTCLGTYTAMQRETRCSNTFYLADSMSITGLNFSQPGPIQIVVTLKKFDFSKGRNADGTCFITSLRDFVPPLAGSWNGTTGSVSATLTDASGVPTQINGTFTANTPPPVFPMVVSASIDARSGWNHNGRVHGPRGRVETGRQAGSAGHWQGSTGASAAGLRKPWSVTPKPWKVWPAIGALVLFGCPGEFHLPAVPKELVEVAQVPGIPDARWWGDVPMPSPPSTVDAAPHEQGAGYQRPIGTPLRVLAISGGGANGSFAAGLLNGWTHSGTRPSFDIVTGVSAGALAAPFAFLGAEYDGTLRELFGGSTGDIVTMRSRLVALLGDSLADPKPLQALLERHFTGAVMEAIAAEHRKGRRLFVGTTNVFASRLVIWDIGVIAASGQPGSLDLIRRVLLASSALPILLPPVYLEVGAAGRRYSEMHVDGGMTRQVFIAPPGFDWPALGRARGTDGRVEFYVIRNGRARPEYMRMPDSLVPLGEHAMHSLAFSEGIGDLYQIYVRAQNERAAFRAAWIDDSFAAPWSQWYDPAYMRALFEQGRRQGLQGEVWHTLPPGFDAR